MTKKPTYEELEQRVKGLENETIERKRMAEKLKENEERLALALDASNSGIWDFNPHTFTDTHYNDKWFTMLGYEPDELPHSAETWTKLMHPEDLDQVQKKLQDHIEGKGEYSAEFRMKTKVNGYRWIRSVGKIVSWDNDGRPQRMIGIHIDISDRKIAEEALRESEEKYRSIFGSATDTFLIFDYDGNIVEANPQACEMYGYSREELIGLSGKDIVHPDYYHLFEKFKKGVQEIGEFYAESVDVRKDGSSFSIEVRGGTFFYKGKHHLLAVVRDISERKQAQDALQESERKYHHQSKVLEGINRVFREALICESEKEIADTCLSVAEELTGSKFGFIGEKNPEGGFDTIAISNPGWDACKMSDSEATILIQNMKIRGIDRSTIREEKSRIVNDPASHPDRIGTPEGHPPITSFLGVPLKYAGKTIGMIGLGNKESGYDRFDQQAIEDLSVAFVEALMRKRAENALRKSEANLSQAQQMAHIGNWNWNIVKNEISWSDEIYRIVGLSPQKFDANYEAYLQCIHPDDLEFFKNITKNVLRDKKPYTAEYRIVRPNGDVRTVQERGEITVDTNGDPTNLFGTAQDLTERKNEEEQYRTIIQTAIDGFCIVDTKGRLLDVNEAACRMLGYQREELLEMHITDVDVRETPDEIREHIQKTIEQGYDSFETQQRRKNGTIIDVQVNVQYSNLRGGVFIAFMRDISEEKRRERALRESEEKFRTVADFNYDWESWVGPDGKYIYVSPSCERITGYSSEEFIKDSGLFTKIVHPDDLESVSVHVKGHLKDTGENHIDFRIKTKGDDIRWISHYCQPVYDEEGKWLGMRASNRDITERMKLRDQLVQSQKMGAVGTLAGGIAHDFNNILSAIMGYSELAKMKATEESEVITDLDEVLRAVKRAKALIQQILTVSRRHKQERHPIQLRYVVKDVLSLLRATLPTTIEIRENLAKDTGIVDADTTQMHQVIMNIGTNAGQAMEKEGGLLTIGLDNAELDDVGTAQYLDMDAGPYLRLSISDTGEGMTPEIIEQIFDPYFTTKEIGEGTGLGLSVAHGIVRSHGGTIRVYSQPGEGSTFHVYLPVIKKLEKPQEEAEGPVPKGNECVLFIDDERTIADIGRQMLGGLGYDVVSTTSSIEALALFRAEPDRFDLIITDMSMPHMAGDKLAEEVMKIRPQIPIILCTGHSKLVSEEKAKEAGIKALVMKPISIRDMAETVRKVLEEK